MLRDQWPDVLVFVCNNGTLCHWQLPPLSSDQRYVFFLSGATPILPDPP